MTVTAATAVLCGIAQRSQTARQTNILACFCAGGRTAEAALRVIVRVRKLWEHNKVLNIYDDTRASLYWPAPPPPLAPALAAAGGAALPFASALLFAIMRADFV
jgi:hypothetical protein